MIVDTGANAHVLAKSFVQRLGLAMKEGEGPTVHDHAGTESKATIVSSPRLVIDGFGEARDDSAVVLDLPPIFDTLQIGGILSPQRLAGPAAALGRLEQPKLRPVAVSTCEVDDSFLYAIRAKGTSRPNRSSDADCSRARWPRAARAIRCRGRWRRAP